MSRLPALTPQPPATARAARDITAAQRAFFQAALEQTAEPAPAPAPAPAAAAAAPATSTPDPERPLRPGSIIDIRV